MNIFRGRERGWGGTLKQFILIKTQNIDQYVFSRFKGLYCYDGPKVWKDVFLVKF